jgi:hypothetical protein
MREYILNNIEIEALFRQDPATGDDGGWQKLLVKLQGQTDRTSGRIDLEAGDLEKIPRYAFTYGNGGWEKRLTTIFARHLGAGLDQ